MAGSQAGFQLGAALLEACVLGVLAKGDAYGYSLTQKMMASVDISESTLYPVLRRLQKDGCLMTYDQPTNGRNRRYYTLTDKGREMYGAYTAQWADFRASIDLLLGDGEVDENEEQ